MEDLAAHRINARIKTQHALLVALCAVMSAVTLMFVILLSRLR